MTAIARPAFDVVELRRYTLRDDGRDDFARHFDTLFPEAFQQLGALAIAQGMERDRANHFTWLRGFADMEARRAANTAFYYGPLWKEHRSTMNRLLLDSDNVLLLTPLDESRRLAVLPAVDAVRDTTGARGVIVLQLFPLKPDCASTFAQQAEPLFARYRAAGAFEAGVLVTLDAENNFPQLPVREDGPWLVWIGVVENDHALEMQLKPLALEYAHLLECTDALRGAPELAVLDPSPRSRLRWRQP